MLNLGCFYPILGRFGQTAVYSVIFPSSLSLNSAVSLNVSSMIFSLPPTSFGFWFSMTSMPLCLPDSSALKSRNACFFVGSASSPSCFLPSDLKKGDSEAKIVPVTLLGLSSSPLRLCVLCVRNYKQTAPKAPTRLGGSESGWLLCLFFPFQLRVTRT